MPALGPEERTFCAAMVAVMRSEKYDLPCDMEEAMVSAQCVMACWGFSDRVRKLRETSPQELIRKFVLLTAEERMSVYHLERKQPFHRAGWEPDPNDNTPVPPFVGSMLRRQGKAPWKSGKEFVDACEEACVEAAEKAETVAPKQLTETYKKSGGTTERDLRRTKAELGANVADFFAW